MVDTKILPPLPENEIKRTELSHAQKIQRSLYLAAERFGINDQNSSAVDEVKEIIEQNWDVFGFLIAAMHDQQSSPETMRGVYQKFFIKCSRLGLQVVVVSPDQMPDRESLEEENNYGQLDVIEGEWVLKFEEARLKERMEALDINLIEQFAHEFAAWRLFTQKPGPYHLKDKILHNQVLRGQDGKGVWQTHFFDVTFNFLTLLNQPQDEE